MRRSGWVVSVATAIVTLWTAGHAGAANWHSGARAGMSFSTLGGDFAAFSAPKTRIGPVLGGTFEMEVARAWSVGVEAMYVQKGARFEEVGTDESGNPIGTFDSNLVLEYAEVPILLRGWMSHGDVRPYIVLGPTFGFALSGRLKVEDTDFDQNFSEDMKPLDVGGTVGAGIRLITEGPWRLDLEGRYFRSFNDLWDIANNLGSINEGFTLTLAGSR